MGLLDPDSVTNPAVNVNTQGAANSATSPKKKKKKKKPAVSISANENVATVPSAVSVEPAQTGATLAQMENNVVPTDSSVAAGTSRTNLAEGKSGGLAGQTSGYADPLNTAAQTSLAEAVNSLSSSKTDMSGGGGGATTVVPPAETPPEEDASDAGNGQYDISPYEGMTDAEAQSRAAELASMTQGGAVNSAMQAAMAAGMSPAQAAFMGARTGSSAYQAAFPEQYNRLKEMGLTEQQIRNTFATTNKGLDIQHENVENVYALGKQGLKQEKSSNIADMLGGIFGAAATALPLVASDINLKKNVEPAWGMLEKVTSSVKPYYYKYTAKGKAAGGGEGQRAGVMAQDLEKTPLKSVVINTPKGKMIDSSSLATANTGMITELSRKLDKAMAYMARGK